MIWWRTWKCPTCFEVISVQFYSLLPPTRFIRRTFQAHMEEHASYERELVGRDYQLEGDDDGS